MEDVINEAIDDTPLACYDHFTSQLLYDRDNDLVPVIGDALLSGIHEEFLDAYEQFRKQGRTRV